MFLNQLLDSGSLSDDDDATDDDDDKCDDDDDDDDDNEVHKYIFTQLSITHYKQATLKRAPGDQFGSDIQPSLTI